MDFKFKANGLAESFKEKLTRSTVFLGAFEQAEICSSRTRRSREVLNIHRESTSLRSSSTYQSSLFDKPPPPAPRGSSNKPKDNISSEFFGSEKSDYYRKSIVSNFKPNFQPQFKYEPTWEIDSKTFNKKAQETKADKEVEANWIKPISKRDSIKNHSKLARLDNRSASPQLSLVGRVKNNENFGYIRSTRASSRAASRAASRPTTPSGPRTSILFTEPGRVNTEESFFAASRIETEPDRYYKSILRENKFEDLKVLGKKDDSVTGSVIEKNFWDYSKELKDLRSDENKYDKVLQAWRNHNIINVFSGNDEKLPSYMRKTISSLCKSKKLG